MMQEQVPQLLLEKKPEYFMDSLVSAYGRYKAAHPKQIAAAARLKKWVIVHAFVVYLGSLFLPEMFKPYIAGTMGVLFAPMVATIPFLFIVILLTGVVAAFGMLLQKYMIDWEFSNLVGARNKALKAEMNEARRANDQEKMKELQEQQLACVDDSSKMLRQMIMPMAYLALFSFPIFIWLYWFFTDHPEYSILFPFLGKIGVAEIYYIVPGWLIWSMLCSFSSSQLFRYLFNVGRSPT